MAQFLELRQNCATIISIRASTIRTNLALGGPGSHAAVILRTPLLVENSTFSGNVFSGNTFPSVFLGKYLQSYWGSYANRWNGSTKPPASQWARVMRSSWRSVMGEVCVDMVVLLVGDVRVRRLAAGSLDQRLLRRFFVLRPGLLGRPPSGRS